jgi:hypothetical protein
LVAAWYELFIGMIFQYAQSADLTTN